MSNACTRDRSLPSLFTTVTLVGPNCSKEIPYRLKSLGAKHPLIVTDKGIVACGILKQITDILDEGGVSYVVFDGAVPNPTDKNVHDAAEVYKANGCDSLITLGGGSSHDCGKGVGFLVSNGGKIQDYEGVDKSSKPFPPYVAVNTTPRRHRFGNDPFLHHHRRCPQG